MGEQFGDVIGLHDICMPVIIVLCNCLVEHVVSFSRVAQATLVHFRIDHPLIYFVVYLEKFESSFLFISLETWLLL